MKKKIILIILVIALMSFLANNLLRRKVDIADRGRGTIQYLIEPAGKSEYKDCGTVDLNGVKANLVTLKSKILFVEVMENIFYDPESSLPYKTERINSGLWVKEYRTEEYDQKKFTVVIKKFRGKKLVKERMIKSDGPIQNVNTLLFYLRKQPDLRVGWHFSAKALDEFNLLKFDLKLLSIDEIAVPAGKFQAYHFKSTPAKFEIWMNKATPQVALRIKIKGVLDCSISMKKYNP